MKFILLALVVCAMAEADKYAQFRAIDQDEFGRTLIDTLQMTMGSGEPILRFTEIMRNLETSIEAEQREDDKGNNDYQSQCTDDIKFLQQESANLERRTTEIQSILDDLTPLRDYKQGLADSKSAWKAELEKKINEKVEKRNQEKSTYDTKIEEIDYATFVISTVKRMFEDKVNSFLQTSDNLMLQVRDYFINASEQSKQFQIKKSYARVFLVFAQIASAAQSEDLKNSPAVGKILSLCDQMLRNLEDSKSLESRAEQKRITMFQLEKALMDKDLTKTSNDLASLVADILQLENRINDQNKDHADYTTRFNMKSKQTEDRGQECREKAFNYQLIREKRESKRQLVSQIIGIFSANQRDFQDYVNLRSGAGDFNSQKFDVLGAPQQ